jgi:hypothetical protein
MWNSFRIVLASVLLVGAACGARAQSSPDAASKPLLHTAVTGSIDASGLDDPQYVLSFVAVQRLMLDATQHPLTKAEVERSVAGTPVSLNQLLQLELLRQEGEVYQLNYLLLTVGDQQTMYRICARYGQSLADAFRAHQAEFDSVSKKYPNAALRPQLMFDLIAGVSLDWRGLDLTTELGYRVQPPRHAKGGEYLIHSSEAGSDLDFTGLYLDSETAPGSKMSFSTFGDGASTPRLEGLPDVLDGGLEKAMEDWQKLPEVYAALRSEYVVLLLLAIDDAGQVMNAVASGAADTDAALAKVVPLPDERRKAGLGLLSAIGYLQETDHRYVVGVPVLTESDKPLVDAVLKLSREITEAWLRANYAAMEKDLSGLSPMRNGLPFSLAFSEAWHYTFGFASKSLAEGGFYANPRAKGNRYEGYVPFVWASSVIKGPGGR